MIDNVVLTSSPLTFASQHGLLKQLLVKEEIKHKTQNVWKLLYGYISLKYPYDNFPLFCQSPIQECDLCKDCVMVRLENISQSSLNA